jgi:hypothetical protein
LRDERDFLKGNTEDQHESFDLKKGVINPISFMGLRGNHYKKDFFFHHPIYEKIKTKILENNLIFITGSPLAGKTRIVYDTLSNLKEGYIVKPKLDKTITKYLFPRRKDLIVFFDELDDYSKTNAEALNNALFYLITNKIKCIATCRTGPEFYQLRRKLHPHIFSDLHTYQITIGRLDKNESSLKSFLVANANQIKNIESFDGYMGALILPLDDMRKRFTSLVEQDKQLPIAILKGLKLHYHLHNYESKKSFYDDAKIFHFCEKYLQEDITKHEWENAKRELTTDETTLNFLDEKEYIIIEEAYLDFLKNANGDSIDVVDSALIMSKIDRLLNDIYKDIVEKKVWGFPTDIRAYNKAIEKAETFEEAEAIFKKFPKGIFPNEGTFSLLMNKTKDKNTLENLYKEAIKDKLRKKFIPESILESSFVGQFEDFGDLLDSILRLDKTVLNRRNNVSNRLIKLSKIEPKQNLALLFSKFSFSEIYNNPVFNEICLNCCKDDEDFRNYVEPYINKVDTLEHNLIKNFIKICSKLNQKNKAVILVEKHLKDEKFDYFNEKGNCFKDAAPLDGLSLYLEAVNSATDEIEQVIAKCNYCNLVYEKGIIEKIDSAINLCSPVIDNKLNIYPAKYLRQILILLEIWRTPIEELSNKIKDLLKRPDINKRKFIDIIEKINDEEKKKIITDMFKPQLPSEIEQPLS